MHTIKRGYSMNYLNRVQYFNYLKSIGVTMVELAKKTGVSYQSIHAIKTGQTILPKALLLEQITKPYGFDYVVDKDNELYFVRSLKDTKANQADKLMPAYAEVITNLEMLEARGINISEILNIFNTLSENDLDVIMRILYKISNNK